MAADLVLITGATGHLGFRTLLTALQAGYHVRAVVRNPGSSKVKLIKASPELAALKVSPDALTFTTVPDFLAPGAFDEAVKGVKYILHIASPITTGDIGPDYDAHFIQPAQRGTLAVLEAAQKAGTVEKIVVTSSVVAVVPLAVFGGKDKSQYDATNRVEFLPGPYKDTFTAYTMSKVAALNSAEAWYREQQPAFSLIHVHPGLIFGADALVDNLPELKTEGSNARLYAAATGTPGPQIGGGVHVNDAAKIHVDALQPQVTGLQSFGASINIDWTQLGSILESEFPAEVKSGLFKAEGVTTGFFDFDSSATEKAFGFKFLGFPEQVKGSVELYVKLAQAA